MWSDGLWLKDTTYTNESLIGKNRVHPEFPGPSFWHFKKTRAAFRRFAGELVIANPKLLGIKQIGHDLDKAQCQGMKDILVSASSMWCIQHVKQRDAMQLENICSAGDKRRILADIYGSQNDILLQSRLADADDEDDFNIKLSSVKDIWEDIAPGFWDWFVKNH